MVTKKINKLPRVKTRGILSTSLDSRSSTVLKPWYSQEVFNKILLDVKVSGNPPYPYIPEKFTSSEKKVLLKFFTNFDKPVFAIHNLPQEVVGAMFSRYSRTAKSVRRLFLDEFLLPGEALSAGRQVLAKWGRGDEDLKKAKIRTQEFYQKVFAEFGDDSVIQMGSVHIAFEFISQLIGAKGVEDQRVGSAYIEKSTRYVDFGSKVDGHYLYMRPQEIMKSRFKNEFIGWSNQSFDAYTKYLPLVIEYLRKVYPIEGQIVQDAKTNKTSSFDKLTSGNKELLLTAYNRALKAKALDTIRFFLPLTTVTNLGGHFSGQAAELTVNKMLVSPFEEVRYFGKMAYSELMKVSPNFMQNLDYKFGVTAREYRKNIEYRISNIGEKWGKRVKKEKGESRVAVLIDYDRDADVKIASEIIFTGVGNSLSKKQIVEWAKEIKKKEGKLFSPTLSKIILGSVPERNIAGRTRRQKLPRAFEHAYAEIEFYTDIGAYKDLQRNRLSSTERQNYTADSLYIPKEYHAPELKMLLKDYLILSKKTKSLHDKIAKTNSIAKASEYITVMGNRVRYSVRANLRQWCFFSELRTISGGHPTYRHALQEAARLIIEKIPFTEKLFVNIDWTKDYGLGRFRAEISTQEKLAKLKKKQ